MRRLSLSATGFTFAALVFMVLSWPVFGAEKKVNKEAGTVKTVAGPVSASTAVAPVKGGILRCIRGTFPKVLGYGPEMGPTDTIFAIPYVEALTVWDEKGDQIPRLAESWKVDLQGKTITWGLRKGVRFHDGTPFNAEAVRWNYQLRLDTNSLTDGKAVKSVEILDEYTVRMNLTEYTSQSLVNYGWVQMFSPTAYTANGGKDWARTHAVGTGPFKLAEFKRDTVIRYERNNNYWRKGYPLLDGIEIRFIPDNNTAAMMMQTKEADVWLDVSDVKNVIALEGKGFKVNWGPGMFWALLPNSNDPKSPFANKKVREALEYALDRPTLAKSLGSGKFEALDQMSSSISPAYIPGYVPRPYNPVKAKQLLAEAGYPDGFETKLLALDMLRDSAIAIQSYLGAVGIRVNLDMADMGRYFVSCFMQGWSDLAVGISGINPDGSDLLVHFGPLPLTFKTGHIAKSPEFLSLGEKALHTYDNAAYRAVLQKAARQASEDAVVIPLYRSAQANIMQPYVHSDYMKIHTVTWNVYQDWIEKRK
jgi:peptide/nickel transport system substrate-binding protein